MRTPNRRLWGPIASSIVALSGCARPAPAWTPPPQPTYYRPPPPTTPAPSARLPFFSPLPQGWIWPVANVDPRSLLSTISSLTRLRPIDVASLAPFRGVDPCAPIEVAKNVWIAPECGAHPSFALSNAIPFRTTAQPTNLPDSVDLSSQGLDGPIKNQQSVGVCWTFALSNAMENALLRSGRREEIAPLHILSAGIWDELFSKGRGSRAITTEPSWPYDPVKACELNEAKSEIWCGQAYHVRPGSWREDPALVAEKQEADRRGFATISRFEKLHTGPGTTDALAGILAAGQTIFAQFDINCRAWQGVDCNAAVGAELRDPVIPDYATPSGSGHAVTLVGYRWSNGVRQFRIHNSWGPTWRDGGYAWISDAMVQRFLRDAATLEVAIGGAAPSPVPPVPPPPQAGACPQGQLPDTVLRICTPQCANGTPTTATLCGATLPSPAGPSPSLPPSLPLPGSLACPDGQLLDVGTGACAARCPSGLPQVSGACW